MISRQELHAYLCQVMEVDRFRDAAPNGLQVEGRPQIRRIVSGVSASQALIQAAIEQEADAVLVHHGLFWRGQSGCLTGWLRQRVAALLQNDLNLWAFHLPLDNHAQWGNNATLAVQLGVTPQGRLGEQDLAWWGELHSPMSLRDWCARIDQQLGRRPMALGDENQLLRRVAWCSGGAQSYFQAAIDADMDAFLTGEVSEQHPHMARESGVAYVAAGHHATERGGVQALGQHLAERFGLEHRFIDLDNPV